MESHEKALTRRSKGYYGVNESEKMSSAVVITAHANNTFPSVYITKKAL